MSMKARTRQQQDITIVDLSGQIKLGEGSSVLHETVKDSPISLSISKQAPTPD